jgi:methyl-accepting chemotaxis protein
MLGTMKTRRLALRVTLHSALMILGVYVVMQSIAYFRDNIILGLHDLKGYLPSVLNFVGVFVVPPLLVFSCLIWAFARPIQKVALRLEAGEELDADTLEGTRRRLLSFSRLVLVLNILGFALGGVLLVVISGRYHEFIEFDRLVVIISNIAAGVVYASAQTALNNMAFAPVRERLGIKEIGARKRESPTTRRQLVLGAFMALYTLTFLQFNGRDVILAAGIQMDTLEALRSGRVTDEGLAAEYRRLLAPELGRFTSRVDISAETLPLPWEAGLDYRVIQRKTFLLNLLFMLAIAISVQAIVSADLRGQIKDLARRMKDVLEGGGDLRPRLNLRAMDDLGELTELVNRFLDQFHGVARHIVEAASQTRDSAAAIAKVMEASEGYSRTAGQSVTALVADLEGQAESSRGLRLVLDSFRLAVDGVNAAADAQRRMVAETAKAMDEMERSISAVVAMTGQAGSLSAELAGRGAEGGQAVNETRAAIGEIETASRRVLEVLGSLSKIAANTNLLAMNAAIEAAHAGENGLGFAVVADEVRSLASTAASETKAIKELIQAMAGRIDRGVQRADTSGSVLERLVAGLRESEGISKEIAQAAEAQTEGTKAVGASLAGVVASCESIRKSMEEETRATDRMASTLEVAMERLQALAASSRHQAEEVTALGTAFSEVRGEVDKNLEAVDRLTREIQRFKV